MTLYVYNRAFEIIGIIDAYSSLIWTNRYYSEGDFELYLPANNRNIQLLQKENFVVRETEMTNAMIIERVIIETNKERGNHLIVSGRCLKSLLSRRIVWSQTTINGRVEVGARKLVDQNAINPTDSGRKIPNLTLGTLKGYTETMSNQYTGDELMLTMITLCQNSGLGWDIKFDADNKQFIFVMCKGTDRSYKQTANPYVLFSNDFDNLISSEYATSQTDYKNVARIGGEGEGLQRRYAVSGSATGLDRRELFIDARDISSNDGAITATDYTAALIERGNERLAEYKKTEAFSGEVDTTYTYKLNRDFFLGDIVEIKNEYGVQASPRIVEIIEHSDENGIRVTPTFSDF